jgi:putative colanic acid biosysnthesis UDP-glucose lipid carrier transferase
MRMKISLRERGNIVKNILHACDCIIVAGYLLFVVNAYGTTTWRSYIQLAYCALAICVPTFVNYQLYRSWRSEALYKEFNMIIKSWSTVVGILLLLLFITGRGEAYSRSVIITWFIGTPIIIFSFHVAIRLVMRRIRIWGVDNKSCVIVGIGRLGRSVANCIQATPWAGIRVLGYFEEDITESQIRWDSKRKILGKISDLPEYASKRRIDYIYVALPMHKEKLIMEVLESCRTLGAELLVVPDIHQFYLINSEVRSLGDMIILNCNPQLGMKRLFDILFASAAICITAPLWIIISMFIKMEDGGPVLYSHARIGDAGRTFKCLKFRTMNMNAAEKLNEILRRDEGARNEWSRMYKLKNDPRITSVGKFLRKTSLDELPQFINVLRGEMSIVGARPIVREELMKYYKKRGGLYCSIRPGMTGPWQVGHRSDSADYDERVQLDSEYILNWSFFKDLKIIGKTVMTMFTRKGAY